MSSEASKDNESSFFETLLTPGSSLHPTSLLILDGAFTALFFVFLMLLWLSSGSIHVWALIGIEMALWASVKWYVKELQSTGFQDQDSVETKLENESTKEKIQ